MRLSLSAFLATIVLLISSLAFAFPATAAPENEDWIPFSDDFDSCSGERVVVTGQQHIFEKTTVDKAGQTHVVFHRNMHGTGIGDVSGAEYLLLNTFIKVGLIGTSEGDTTVFNQFSEEVFIRKGETRSSDDDTYARFLTHYTITPDGTLTADTEIISAGCR